MNIYKHLNLFFYRFAQILWVGGVLAAPADSFGHLARSIRTV